MGRGGGWGQGMSAPVPPNQDFWKLVSNGRFCWEDDFAGLGPFYGARYQALAYDSMLGTSGFCVPSVAHV